MEKTAHYLADALALRQLEGEVYDSHEALAVRLKCSRGEAGKLVREQRIVSVLLGQKNTRVTEQAVRNYLKLVA